MGEIQAIMTTYEKHSPNNDKMNREGKKTVLRWRKKNNKTQTWKAERQRKEKKIGALQGRKCWQRKAAGEVEKEKGEIGNHKRGKRIYKHVSIVTNW